MGVQKSGSRLSVKTKKSIMAAKKSGSLTGAQAQALRKSLRTTKIEGNETKLRRASGMSKHTYDKQVVRTTTKAAAKRKPTGGKTNGSR